ncbi:DnaJ domain-containing protein [Paraburkholderia metrosideri]|uniref:DnaJ domain-containing protein n=1 Tax=Paraburkholderia metrosideri TaxID=580937 RepID=A0ABW9DSI9_9BURK
MNVHSHYENLKVSRDAPPEVIRAAYKALSMLWHPDRSPDPRAPEIMKTINIAYETLSDPATRQLHDQWLTAEELKWTSAHPEVRQPAQPKEPEPAPEVIRKRSRAFEIDEQAFKAATKQKPKMPLRWKAACWVGGYAVIHLAAVIFHGSPAG